MENGSNGKPRGPTVEDENDERPAEGALPEGFFEDEDEDGRFFGGGVSEKQSAILDFIDEQDKEGETKVCGGALLASRVTNGLQIEIIDKPWLRRTALDFEKKINKNAEMRGKFEDEPHKFAPSHPPSPPS